MGAVRGLGRRPRAAEWPQADHADVDYHLTTLFPPVRPRRWLEIRYLDSVPDALWPALAFALTTLPTIPQAADAAAEAVEPVATAWDTAARAGLADRHLFAAANTCVATAAGYAPPELAESMRRLVELVEQGRSSGDDFSDRVIDVGILPAVDQLAREEL